MNKESRRYWQQGLNQPEISKGSDKRQPAFDYSDLDHTSFSSDNWNDVMLHPLREFLDSISFIVPFFGTVLQKKMAGKKLIHQLKPFITKSLMLPSALCMLMINQLSSFSLLMKNQLFLLAGTSLADERSKS